MGLSGFDFELEEATGLIRELTALAKVIELKPRIHHAEESEEIHTVRTEATYRISCQLSGNDEAVRILADLEPEIGVAAVLGHGRSVRFRRSHPNPAAPLSHGRDLP
jgi:hypothetical protein